MATTPEQPLQHHVLESINPKVLQEKFGWKMAPDSELRLGGTGHKYLIGQKENIELETYTKANLITLTIPETNKMSDVFDLHGYINMNIDEVKVSDTPNEEELILVRHATKNSAEMIITITKSGELTMLRGKEHDLQDAPVPNVVPPGLLSNAVELTPAVAQELKAS